MLAAFKALRLNLGVSEVVESVLLDAETWERIEQGNAPGDGDYVLGVDLGATAAMSAAAAYWPDTGAADTFAVFPSTPGLGERGLADGVGDLYVRCAERGELIIGGEFTSDVRTLLGSARTVGNPAAIVCDRWREGDLREALAAVNFPMAALVVRGAGYKDGGEDTRLFRRAALDGRLQPRRSRLLRSAMAQARVVMDTAGNSKLAKGVRGRAQAQGAR